MCFLFGILLLASAAGQAGAGQVPLPASTSLDVLTTPTLGGQGRVLWCVAPDAPLGPATLTFSLEAPNAAQAKSQSQALNLGNGRTQDAEFAFATPVAGRYRILARLDWTGALGTLTQTDSLALEVLANGAVRQVPDIISLAVGARLPVDGVTGLRLDNTCSGEPKVYRAAFTPDFAGALWQPYSVAPVVPLPAAGAAAVYFQVCDGTGNLSAPASLILTVPMARALKVPTPAPAATPAPQAALAIPATPASTASTTTAASPDFATGTPQVTTPPSGQLMGWPYSRVFPIRWQGFQGTKVRIDLLDGAKQVLNITASTTRTTNIFYWTIPSTLSGVHVYQIKVSTLDATPADSAISGDLMLADNPIYPGLFGIYWFRGYSYTITWTPIPDADNVRIDLLKGDILQQILAPSVANSKKAFTWKIPADYPEGLDYKMRIVALDSPTTRTITSSVAFSITGPKMIWPDAANTYALGNNQLTINWGGMTASRVKIELYQGTKLNRVLAASAPNTGWFLWSMPLSQKMGANFFIKVTEKDDSPQSALSANPFTIEIPRVTSPNKSGMTFKRGSKIKVKWAGFLDDNVAIGLYQYVDATTGYALRYQLIASTPNDGSETLTLPKTITPATNYRLRITSTAVASVYDYADYSLSITK